MVWRRVTVGDEQSTSDEHKRNTDEQQQFQVRTIAWRTRHDGSHDPVASTAPRRPVNNLPGEFKREEEESSEGFEKQA